MPALKEMPALEDLAPEVGAPLEGSQTESMPPVIWERELSLDELGGALPKGLIADVSKAVLDTERTRLVVKAITQLLVEKQILALEEIQSRVAQLKASDSKAQADQPA